MMFRKTFEDFRNGGTWGVVCTFGDGVGSAKTEIWCHAWRVQSRNRSRIEGGVNWRQEVGV